jgi:hypothetical protein
VLHIVTIQPRALHLERAQQPDIDSPSIIHPPAVDRTPARPALAPASGPPAAGGVGPACGRIIVQHEAQRCQCETRANRLLLCSIGCDKIYQDGRLVW